MGEPEPSELVWERLASGDKIGAIKAYHEQTGLDLKTSKRVIMAMADGTHNADAVIHRKRGSRSGVMKWYGRDTRLMSQRGYVEVSHEVEGVARGCGAFFLPKQSEMIVTYRRLE